MKKTYVYGFSIFIFLVATYVLIVYILRPDTTYYLTREDGITENLSVIFSLFTACIFFYLFIQSKSTYGKYFLKTNRNYFFLLLSIFCFIMLGEEINWGQRIFNIKTPDWVFSNSTERQLNLHNKEALFYFFGIRFSAGRIYFLFCILYFMLIPIVNKYSAKMQYIFHRISLPIAPVFVAIFFILNFILWHLVLRYFDFPVIIDGISPKYFVQAVMEIYEFNFTILLLWFSLTFFINKREET